jgi:hypothetical protein
MWLDRLKLYFVLEKFHKNSKMFLLVVKINKIIYLYNRKANNNYKSLIKLYKFVIFLINKPIYLPYFSKSIFTRIIIDKYW